MHFNKLLHLFYLLLIWHCNITANAVICHSLRYLQLETTDTTEIENLSSEEEFNPVTPVIPSDNLQPSINVNDFIDQEYKKYPLPPDVSSTINNLVVYTPINNDVSPIGAATFNIPIEVPPGVGTMEPQLSISYNSMHGNGIVGLGCSVQGLSSITRSVRDIYHNQNAGGLSYNEYDALLIDGKRLIPKGYNIMTDGKVYVLEDNPFTEVVLHGTTTGIWFEVKASDGRTMRYGDTENSRQTIFPASGSPFVNAWYISHAEDCNGNYLEYEYIHDDQTVYPQKISYGKNLHTSEGADNTVNFVYEDRSDKYQYKIKTVSGNMSKRLRSIEIKTGDAQYRYMKLFYSRDYGSEINRLCRVQVWRNDKRQQKSIEISWRDSPGLLPTTVKLDVNDTNIALTKKSNQRFLTGDINGDGVSDIIEFAKVDISLGGNKTGHSNYCIPYFSSVNPDGKVSYCQKPYLDIGPDISMDKWTVNNGLPFISDINGDGMQDLVIPVYNDFSGKRTISFNVYWGNTDRLSPQTASCVSAELVNAKCMPLYTSVDFDNDGHSEIICIEPSQGNSGTNICQIITYAKDEEYITPRYFDIVLNVTPQRLFTADFNGDGLTDFMIVHKDGCYTYLNKGNGCMYSGFQSPVSDINVKSSDLTDIGDFNGDGIPDVVMFSDGKFTIALGNGDGHFTTCPTQKINGIDRSGFNSKLAQTLVYDFDGDGKSDLVMAKADKNKGHTYWLRSTETSFILKRDVPSIRKTDSTTGYYALGDFNGDGFIEVMNYGYDTWGGTETAEASVFRIYPNNVDPSTGKVQNITDGMGNRATFSYKSLATGGLYKKRNDAEYPMLDCIIPLSVVSSVKRTNGVAGENTTEYDYEGLKVHLQGKGLLGMTRATATNKILGTINTTEVTKWNTDYFVPQKVQTVVNTGDATETTETTVEITDKGNKALFIYPQNIRITDADGNITERTAVYDTKNGTVTATKTSYNDGSYTQTEYGDYVKKGGMWHAQNITERRKHTDDNEEYTDKTKFIYNGNGNVSERTLHSDTPKQVKTTFWYDGYGNVSSYINEGNGINGTEYYNGYDATGRFILKKDNDTDPKSISYTYDTFGNLLTETDETDGENPLTIRHFYNTWGQEVKTAYPEGAEIKTWFGWGPNLGMRYYKLTYCLGQPWQKTWYDSCGRIVKTETITDGGILSTTETTYNCKGLETSTIQNTGKLSISTEKEYDDRGRITAVRSSSGKSMSFSYENRKLTITDNGRSTVKEYDAQGHIRKVTDPLTSIEYRYFSNGKPSEISCGGNIIRMEYDEAGNRILLDDPDAGKTTSVFDAEGKILSQTDGRGVKRSFNYDDWGRLSSMSGATTNIVYSYDKHDNVINAWHNGNRMASTYDKYNRTTTEYRYFDDGETQVHKYKYDKFNNIVKETFPSGNSVDYVYDSYGICTAYIMNGDTVWAKKTSDGLTYTESIFDGKLSKTRTLDNYGYLKKLDLYKADTRLRGMKYTYDGTTGNMMRRETIGSKTAETFSYDDLDRLVKKVVTPVVQSDTLLLRDDLVTDLHSGSFTTVNPGTSIGDKVFSERNTTKYQYSTDGNILSFPVAGNYTYCQEKPHAVESVSNPSGKISSSSQEISYNDINKIDGISERKSDGWYVLGIYYGPDNERWTSNLQVNIEDVKAIHYGNGYEKTEERGNIREFTYLGNGILHYRENGEEGKLLYMFTDALGSITDIFDAEGNSVFQAEYNPWGNMTVTHNDIGFIRGYTGHEMLTDFGLINMNGRTYDPLLGRFLSPDNYVQIPENSQNFNRYSYCLNNPLKYTDPSGEVFGIDDLFVFLAGGTLNVVGNAVSGNIKSFWHGAELFCLGGVAGLATEYGGATVGAIAIGAGNSIINQGNEKGWGNISWSEVGTSTIMSCITSAAGQYLTSAYSSLFENYTGGISNEILKRTLNQSFANSLSGFTLGSAMSLASGASLNKALENGWYSAAEGAVTGAISGYIQGIYERDANAVLRNIEALDEETNPDNIVSDVLNNPLTPTGTGTNSVYLGRDNNNIVHYVGITQRNPQERFSEHLRSKSNRSTLIYEPIQSTGNLSRRQALIIEQRLVNLWKMEKNGGILYNKINPITPLDWNKYGIK